MHFTASLTKKLTKTYVSYYCPILPIWVIRLVGKLFFSGKAKGGEAAELKNYLTQVL